MMPEAKVALASGPKRVLGFLEFALPDEHGQCLAQGSPPLNVLFNKLSQEGDTARVFILRGVCKRWKDHVDQLSESDWADLYVSGFTDPCLRSYLVSLGISIQPPLSAMLEKGNAGMKAAAALLHIEPQVKMCEVLRGILQRSRHEVRSDPGAAALLGWIVNLAVRDATAGRKFGSSFNLTLRGLSCACDSRTLNSCRGLSPRQTSSCSSAARLSPSPPHPPSRPRASPLDAHPHVPLPNPHRPSACRRSADYVVFAKFKERNGPDELLRWWTETLQLIEKEMKQIMAEETEDRKRAARRSIASFVEAMAKIAFHGCRRSDESLRVGMVQLEKWEWISAATVGTGEL
jgi:hypothetical protein